MADLNFGFRFMRQKVILLFSKFASHRLGSSVRSKLGLLARSRFKANTKLVEFSVT